MTDKPAESAVERYEAEYRSWAELHGNGTPSTATWTNIVLETIRRADAALVELKANLAAAEAALAWYKNWAIVTVARERGGLWSNRDDKERAALKLEAEVDLERTRKTGGYR